MKKHYLYSILSVLLVSTLNAHGMGYVRSFFERLKWRGNTPVTTRAYHAPVTPNRIPISQAEQRAEEYKNRRNHFIEDLELYQRQFDSAGDNPYLTREEKRQEQNYARRMITRVQELIQEDENSYKNVINSQKE